MSDPDPATTWHRIRREIRGNVNEATWHIWLERVSFRALDGTTLVLQAPDDVRSWVQGRFARVLSDCAASVLGAGARVEIVGPDDDLPPAQAQATSRERAHSDLNPRLTFDQFVIGESNRLAHAAALAVAEMPGLAWNPLFICGPPGLGKTHLLHSIGNYILEHGDGLTVRYTTAESFTDEFLGALHSRKLEAFKAAYRGVDVLLVDDVQFLVGKAKTEEEFFHTFNELHTHSKQLVLTSDRPPRDIDALQDRLRDRFQAGLVSDVRPADRGTRLTILRKRVIQDDIADVEPAALETIAERVDTNVRALEGALIRVVAFGSLTGRAVTGDLAGEVLDGLYPELKPRRTTVREIQEQTAAAFHVSLEDLVSASRSQAVAWPRQVAMYLARELTGATLPAIGRAFGRNHTTVMHACRRAAERIASDPEAYEAVRELSQRLGGS